MDGNRTHLRPFEPYNGFEDRERHQALNTSPIQTAYSISSQSIKSLMVIAVLIFLGIIVTVFLVGVVICSLPSRTLGNLEARVLDSSNKKIGDEQP